MNATDHGLGRRVLPEGDDLHLQRYSLAPVTTSFTAERILSLPNYRTHYNQGNTNACVGFSSSWAMSILNRERYFPPWLWDQAKLVDGWQDTNPGDNNGTSVRAGMDVLRTLGHREVYGNITKPADPNDGILRNEWATNVDQIRSCLANGVPVVLGIEWFQSFFQPERRGYESWIGRNVPNDKIVGGHAICAYGVSDRRQAVRLVNSWGTGYPLVWLSYEVLQKLLNGVQRGRGEATVIVDRPER
ncbi:MAG: hypothetical protein ACR2OE_07515 [Thermomicrobiales bacterium]